MLLQNADYLLDVDVYKRQVLVITADSVQPGTVKAFKKKFGKKVIIQTPPEEIPTTTIQFPLPLKPTK